MENENLKLEVGRLKEENAKLKAPKILPSHMEIIGELEREYNLL